MFIQTWNIESITGYKPITTFYEDFSIADCFGESAVEDTFKNAFKHWRNDYKYLTELVLALNWKSWYHHDKGNDRLCELYVNLWKKASQYALDHLHGEELDYYFRVTD